MDRPSNRRFVVAVLVIIAATASSSSVMLAIFMLLSSSLLHADSAQKPDERIDVRAREISVNLSLYGRTLTGYHLYIVYSDAAGQEFVCEGFPSILLPVRCHPRTLSSMAPLDY